MDCHRRTLVWNCVFQTWAMLATQRVIAQMLPEQQFQTALGGGVRGEINDLEKQS